MPELSGIPYAEVELTKDGAVHDDRQVRALGEMLDATQASDLLAIAHGWNNDLDDARRLYTAFFQRVREVLDRGVVEGLGQRRLAVLGLLWPSKKFAEKDLIPSGAAGLRSPTSDAAIEEGLGDLQAALDDPAATTTLREARRLVPRLEDDPAARERFADLVRSLLPAGAADDDDASSELFQARGADLMARLGTPVGGGQAPRPSRGGAPRLGAPVPPPGGGAAGLLSFLDGPRAAARNLLNYATYYKMKERAGLVGRAGANQVLRAARGGRPDLRLHLIGHSFGGRLVTAAALGPDGQAPLRVDTMTLLQAAFSHHGFAQRWEGSSDGLFRRVLTEQRVSGPVLVTCTRNDTAVGLAYPIASQIARQAAAWLGDKNDRYGGIGANGAQKTPEALDETLLAVGSPYELQRGRLHNLKADAFIANHADICKNEVAYAILVAVSAS
jgi:hypothetical protein